MIIPMLSSTLSFTGNKRYKSTTSNPNKPLKSKRSTSRAYFEYDEENDCRVQKDRGARAREQKAVAA